MTDSTTATRDAFLPYASQQWTLAFWTRRAANNVPMILANGAYPVGSAYANGANLSITDLTCLWDGARSKEGWGIYIDNTAGTSRSVVLRFHAYDKASGSFETDRVYSLVIPGLRVTDGSGTAKWDHLAVTCEGQRVTLYLNGSSAGKAWSSTDSTLANRTAENASAASVELPEGFSFHCPVSSSTDDNALRSNTQGQAATALDEIAVWSRSLSAYEIAKIVAGGEERPAKSLPEFAAIPKSPVVLSFNFHAGGQALNQGASDTGLTGAAAVPENKWNNMTYLAAGTTLTSAKDENGFSFPVNVTMRGGNGSSANTSNGNTTPNGRLMRAHVWSRTKWEVIFQNLPDDWEAIDAYIYTRDGGALRMRSLHVDYPDGQAYQTASNYWYWDASLRKALVSDFRFNFWDALYGPAYEEGKPLMEGSDYLCATGVSIPEDRILRVSGWRGIDDTGVPSEAINTFPHLIAIQLVNRGPAITLNSEAEVAISSVQAEGQSLRINGSGTLLLDQPASALLLTIEGDAEVTLKPTDGATLTVQGLICNAPELVIDVSAMTVDELTIINAGTGSGPVPQITLVGEGASSKAVLFNNGTITVAPFGGAFSRTLSGGSASWSDADAYSFEGTPGFSWFDSPINTLDLTVDAESTLGIDRKTALRALTVSGAPLTLTPTADPAGITVTTTTFESDVTLEPGIGSLGDLTLAADKTLVVNGPELPAATYAQQPTSTLKLNGDTTYDIYSLFGKGMLWLDGTHALNTGATIFSGINADNKAVLKITGSATVMAADIQYAAVHVDGGTLTLTRNTTSVNAGNNHGMRLTRGAALTIENGGKVLCSTSHFAPSWDNTPGTITVSGQNSLLSVKGFRGDNVETANILVSDGAVLAIGSYGYMTQWNKAHDVAFSNATLRASANWTANANSANAASSVAFRQIIGSNNIVDPAGYTITMSRPFTGMGNVRLESSTGSGALIMHAANTMSGTLTVASGNTLGGAGSLAGPLTFEAGSIFRKPVGPDNALTVEGTLTFPAEGSVTVEMPSGFDPVKDVRYYLFKGAGAIAAEGIRALTPPMGVTIARDSTGIYVLKPTGLLIMLY